MKTNNNMCFGIYDKDELKISYKKVLLVVSILIVGLIYLIFGLSFKNYKVYYLEEIDGKYYITVPYSEKDIVLKNNSMIINKKKYKYNFIKIENYLSQNEKVYLQINLSINDLKTNMPLIEIKLNSTKINLFDYLKNNLGG